MKKVMIIGLLLLGQQVFAQELFVYTEPASNSPKGYIGGRITNVLMKRAYNKKTQYNLLPEITIGLTKKLMLRGEGIFSTDNGALRSNGASLYAKYRFLSRDDVQQHFRMAAFARLSYNNMPLHQQEIETAMFNSGYEGGLVATQLLHKVALSATASYERATFWNNQHSLLAKSGANAVNYSFSAGKLMLPKQYKNFRQTNLNLMIELLGQMNTGLKKSYLDVAPSVQLIFHSRWRVDAGYRQQLYSGLKRMAKNSFLMRLEYSFFNVF